MQSATATLWEISIESAEGEPAAALAHEVAALAPLCAERLKATIPSFHSLRGFIVAGGSAEEAVRIAEELLADTVIERTKVQPLAESVPSDTTLTVMRKPGVMDPVALSAFEAVRAMGHDVESVWTFTRHVFPEGTPKPVMQLLARKIFANDAIEQVVYGPVDLHHLAAGSKYEFVKLTVPIRGMNDAELEELSRKGQLYLNVAEMRTIRDHFDSLGRNPTDIELETLAQTWSEHCSHKTLRGPYEFNGQRSEQGLLKETIMQVTRELNLDWCVSVFKDNAGVIKFDDKWNVCFKVETHNHPSAIEPYGGSNTGIGGCIRDPMGTGLGAKPICNTDVFCVAPPSTKQTDLPEGVLHPERVLRGVVSGVRDYGNRMGIPTVNGAVCFDERYLGNPLVYCGVVGLIPADKSFGTVHPGDLIVAMGGRTGRDGIHGATFSSGELTTESETVSGGAVQIGNAITQKKVADILLQARDQNLFNAVTDCGAGGFSSAVGEMGETTGAKVLLENAPLKYEGLSYTEIWISEAQERMVFAVPPEKWPSFKQLAESEDVEAFVLGTFEPTGNLTLTYNGEVVGELSMDFLHNGRPAVVHKGEVPSREPSPFVTGTAAAATSPGQALHRILGSLNVCSKEWIVRQYDHEVQGGSIVKPLTGIKDDGPSDAAVVAPVLGSTRGIAVGCGINPRFGDLDPYWMAASAIDEAVRNVVAVGGDPTKCALLDNFCWGNTERPEVFGSLCEAAFACRDIARVYRTPFISGKDSLYNEFNTGSELIVIPPTLLISAMAIVPDVRRSMTMDLKAPGNALVLVGSTLDEMGGSQFTLMTDASGGSVPKVEAAVAVKLFQAVHRTISLGLARSCHDLSDGGLAVAAAEMAFAGGVGATIRLNKVPTQQAEMLSDDVLLFSESNSRLLLEVPQSSLAAVLDLFNGLPCAVIGETVAEPTFEVKRAERIVLSESLASLKKSWQSPLAW